MNDHKHVWKLGFDLLEEDIEAYCEHPDCDAVLSEDEILRILNERSEQK